MIQHVKIVNFEKIKEFQSELHPNTIVEGKNGTGKTAIARAIIWCLTGRDIDGQANATRYLGSEKGGTSVAVKVDGVVYERYRTKTKMTFAIDGEPAPDNAFLRKYDLHGESLLVLFFPGFFLKMNEMKQREVFTACAPEVDENALLKELLGDIDFTLTEPAKVAYKTFNDLKIQHEKRLEVLKSRTDASRGDAPSEEEVNEAKRKQEEIAGKHKTLENEIAALHEQQKAYGKYMLVKTQFEIVRSQRESIIAQNTENQKKRDEQKNEPEFREHQKSLQKKLIKIQADLAHLKNEGLRLRNEYESLKKGEALCPTCGAKREVDADLLAATEAGLKQARLQYANLDAENVKVSEEMEEINEVCRGFISVPADKPVPVLPLLPEESLDVDSKLLTEKQQNKYALDSEVSAATSKYVTLRTLKNSADAASDQSKKNAEDIINTERALAKAEKIVAALHPKTGLPSIALKKRMEKVSIPGFQFHFVEQLKNGEERECFHITREDDIPLNYLSSGEQIKFCVALSQLMVSLTGTSFKSVFLERDDLVDCALSPEGFQVIREKVSGEGTVKVENGN